MFIFCLFSNSVIGQTAPLTNLKWHDARDFTIEGKGWTETKSFYDRLPAKAESVVRPPVWSLAQNSSGLRVRFITDSPEVSVRWKLRNQLLSLPNMAAMSVSGVDLYVRDNDKWRWTGVGRPDKNPVNEVKVIGNMARRSREYMLYLPLYNGVESVELGLPENVSISRTAPFPADVKPMVFYGTSIVQGASASRAGLAYPAILSRRLNRPFINLGFSGNCRMEPEMAALLAELDPSVYFIDCLPNIATGEDVGQKTPNLVQTLRRAHPLTPIVLVENILYPDIFIEDKKRATMDSKNAALRKVYNNLRQAGIKNLYYIPAANLIGADGEGTIDGVHPTDTGFERMAAAFEPVLRKILK